MQIRNNYISKNFFKFLYIIFILFFSIGASEISIFFVSNANKKIEKSFYLKNKNINFKRTITSMLPNKEEEIVSFKTDYIGSIYPSSLSNIRELNNYILFCGGSTTEASQVTEGKRPPDIASKLSGKQAINIAKAGQDLSKCINRVEDFFIEIKSNNEKKEKVKLPQRIFISTSINTLMEFGRTKANNSIKNNNKFLNLKTPSLVYKFFEYRFRQLLFGIKLSKYEQALLDGCCYGLAEINSSKTGKEFLDWDSKMIHDEYKKYLGVNFQKLKNLSKKYSYEINNFIIVIEPDSFSIPYKKVFRPYWKGVDARQRMHKYNGEKMSNNNARKVLIKYNDIYKFVANNFGFRILEPAPSKFPEFSFYDAVHYTDKGSKFIGEIYAKEINKLK